MSKSVGAGLAYDLRLYACSVCDIKALLQMQSRLVVLCRCYMPLPLTYAVLRCTDEIPEWLDVTDLNSTKLRKSIKDTNQCHCSCKLRT